MAEETIRIGDQVRLKVEHSQVDSVGTVDGIDHLSGEPAYLVRFSNGQTASLPWHVLEKVVPSIPQRDMAGNANAAEPPLVLREGARRQQTAYAIGGPVQVIAGAHVGLRGTITKLHELLLDPSGTVGVQGATIRTEDGSTVGPVPLHDIEPEPRRDVPGMASGVTEPVEWRHTIKVGNRVRFRQEHAHEYPLYAGRVFTVTDINEHGVTIAFGGRTEVVPSIPAHVLEVVPENPTALGVSNADHSSPRLDTFQLDIDRLAEKPLDPPRSDTGAIGEAPIRGGPSPPRPILTTEDGRPLTTEDWIEAEDRTISFGRSPNAGGPAEVYSTSTSAPGAQAGAQAGQVGIRIEQTGVPSGVVPPADWAKFLDHMGRVAGAAERIDAKLGELVAAGAGHNSQASREEITNLLATVLKATTTATEEAKASNATSPAMGLAGRVFAAFSLGVIGGFGRSLGTVMMDQILAITDGDEEIRELVSTLVFHAIEAAGMIANWFRAAGLNF